MKIIFLDIDGVLNTSQTFIDIHKEWKTTGIRRVEIDEFRVKYLADIIKETNAKIVLSSSWRIFWNDKLVPLNNQSKELERIFNKYNIKIFSKTCYGKFKLRQEEIDDWLNNHNNIDNFIIIDDESFDLNKYVGNKLIKTSIVSEGDIIRNMDDCIGLSKEHISKAIKLLNN